MKTAWNEQFMSRFYQQWFRVWRLKYRSMSDSGFTLIELLVVMLLGGILTSSLLWLVIQLVSSDQRESVRTETDREVQLSLDYMITDLREAVYIYNGDCNNLTGANLSCPSYGSFIPSSLNDSDSIPVLAFWKTHPLDLTSLQADVDALTGDLCSNYAATVSTAIQIAESECDDVRLQRNSYELVVYVHETARGSDWEGESRIRRYSLDKYDGDPRMIVGNLETTLRWTNGYVDPAQINNNFFGWPFDSDGNNCQSTPGNCDNARGVNLNAVSTGSTPVATGSAGPVLMDFVAHPRRKYEADGSSALVTTESDDPDIATICPGGYSHVPRAADTNPLTNDRLLSRNFYACVRNVTTSGDFQDAIIYLRGNPLNRGGVSSTIVRPLTQTQVTMRGIIDRNP